MKAPEDPQGPPRSHREGPLGARLLLRHRGCSAGAVLGGPGGSLGGSPGPPGGVRGAAWRASIPAGFPLSWTDIWWPCALLCVCMYVHMSYASVCMSVCAAHVHFTHVCISPRGQLRHSLTILLGFSPLSECSRSVQA